MGTAANLELLVREGDLAEIDFVESAVPSGDELAPNELLVRVEKFGFSANNVTYAVLGRRLNYFDFFPAERPGWGKIPVWGMGAVVDSRHPDLAPGARFYGYFPLARYVTLLPARRSAPGFDVDRGALPAVYNQYALVGSDPFHLPAQEDQMLLFRPLVLTGLLLDDYLADGHDYFGADTVVVSSASSKTSLGLAFLLARRGAGGGGARRCRLIGLTSARHVPFVGGLGLYDRVLAYDAVASLPRGTGTVLVDVAGDAGVLRQVHEHLGDDRRMTILVGISHWERSEAGASDAAATAERTHFFFAPSWVEQRQREWGAARMVDALSEGWRAFMEGADRRCRVVRGTGADAVAAAYRATLRGEQRPDEGWVLSLWDDAFGGRRAAP
jgi:hypothetical protein